MWVMNQDGLGIVEVQALSLDPAEFMNEENRKNGVRVWGSISDHDYVLGVYPTIEEALEAIQDFKSHIVLNKGPVFIMPRAKENIEVAQ